MQIIFFGEYLNHAYQPVGNIYC